MVKPPSVVIKPFGDFHGGLCRHAFFTRRGGVSDGIYESLNCGAGSGDAPDNIRQNLKLVRNALEADTLHKMNQTHSAECLVVDAKTDPDHRHNADALVTDIPGVAIGVLTADCAPVLFAGMTTAEKPVIGVAHAGWGGAFRGILESTLARMVACGAQKQTIGAAIGPCIQQASYEVGLEFQKRFIEHNPENDVFFKSGRDDKFHFDLPGYCAKRLADSGLSHIFISGEDTYSRPDRYFSYRRKTHEGIGDYGRQISCMVIPKI